MIMIDIEFLDKAIIFQGLNQEQLTAVIKYCEEAEFQPGAKLFTQGEDAAYLWIVKEGQVDLRFEVAGSATPEEHTISSISAAGAFGWSSFTSPNKYRLSGYCGDMPCRLIKVDRAGLLQLFEEDPQIGYVVISNVASVIGTRFHEFREEAARQRGQEILGGW
jgi:CRP-like cAMP-binding protein